MNARSYRKTNYSTVFLKSELRGINISIWAEIGRVIVNHE